MSIYKTEQEKFWAGDFGDEYIERNKNDDYLACSVSVFSNIFNRTGKVASAIEFGANVGLNLRAIQLLLPNINLSAIEINKKAMNYLAKIKNLIAYNESILNISIDKKIEFVFSKGVLIHINPKELTTVYQKMYEASSRYICLIEYYNPSPIEISYRGHKEKMYKRDFAGEMLSIYPDLKLIDYEFCYHKDNTHKHDDATWFLMEKR